MAFLDPNEAFEHFSSRTSEAISSQFPIKGKTHTVVLKKIEIKNPHHPDDLRSQFKAKVEGGSFVAPLYGHLELVDNVTGKVLDSRKMRLAEIPVPTQRYSYIVEGSEYQVDNQWQLKPGAYVRRRPNGELETQFNVKGASTFDVTFDDKKKQFLLEYGKSKLPLYPFMRALGVGDEELERTWGKEIFAANKSARGSSGALLRFHKSLTKRDAATEEEATEVLRQVMQGSKLRKDSTEITLGKPFEHVTGEAMHLATQKMLKVQAGHPEDDRDSLLFKDFRSAGDYAHDKISASRKTIQQKVLRNLGNTEHLGDIIKFGFFNDAVKKSLTDNAASRFATQINPVEMISSVSQTTIMGSGGIQSDQQITENAKMLNPTHFGFLDPLNTPEGGRTGVTLRLPLGVRKIGNDPMMPLFNLKTGKMEMVSPATFFKAKVVLADQVTWKDGKPVPVSDKVMVVGHENKFEHVPFGQAEYAMKHNSQMLNLTSNLVPFVANDSGGRVSMATRHMEQAISLANRQQPLVQVGTGAHIPGGHTFEQVVGNHASHSAPVDGVVHQVKEDAIILKDAQGKTHEVQIYNNYPLNDAKGVFHSIPTVKPGDKVKTGQLIADSNFTKNGTLALGTNLRVAYMTMKGYNFEDGVVISESAAKNKLASFHLHKHFLPVDDTTVFGAKKFRIQHPGIYKPEQFGHLDEQGVAKVGSIVKPGDPLVLAMKPFELSDRVELARIRKSLSGGHADKSMRWEGETPGEVVSVTRGKTGLQVHVRTLEPMQVGDKCSNRHGAKGIISAILPDHEMPHDKDGKPVEMIQNFTGIPSRMNPGQLFEAAAAKIALKTGKPYVINNFPHGVDMSRHIQAELKAHGLSDTEELIDPITKKSYGQVMVGHPHIFKLVHQVDKKVAISPGMGLPGMAGGDRYDLNLQPAKGQRVGALGIYALLAHGANANLREMATWKGEGEDPQPNPGKRWQSQHLQVWNAIQTGAPLPTPKSTFAFKKFSDMLKGAGVNIEKKGHEFILSPLTDKHILELSENRSIPKPAERLEARADSTGELKVRPGGLFDEKLTGGHGGTKWAHIELAEPVPNPLFEAPIRALTGLTKKDFHDVVHGHKGITQSGQLTDMKSAHYTGGEAIQRMLQKVDVPSALAKAEADLKKAKPLDVDPMMKKVKYLRALDQMGMKPHEAYVLTKMPVIPPVLRPASLMSDGNVKYADINELYKDFALINSQLQDPVLRKHLPEEKKTELRQSYYDGVKAVFGFGIPYAEAKNKGLLHQIAGSSPKLGFFQQRVVQKRQDLTMRSTIVPEPALGLDEVGLPKQHAVELFRVFLVKKLQDMGAAKTPLEAQKLLTNPHTPTITRALEQVMAERPVLLKRDPALHKYSIQGFQPRVVEGNAIRIHPLVCGGFNADFDGDTMSVFVPISRHAVDEAHKMKPTANLFSEASGSIAYSPTLESALGLYKMSLMGKETGKSFTSSQEAIQAAKDGKIHPTDIVSIGGKKTTAARAMLANALPAPLQHDVLYKPDFKLNKSGLSKLLTTLGKNHQPEFDKSINALKDLGNGASTGVFFPDGPTKVKDVFTNPQKAAVSFGAHTLTLKDFEVDKATRDPILHAADKAAEAIRASKTIPEKDKDRQVIEVYSKADAQIAATHKELANKNPNNLFEMHQAGIKPSWDNYKQMRLAPVLMLDSMNRIVPTPVKKGYGEGMDMAGYWIQMMGARRGTVMKVQEVQEPGYLTKLLQANVMDTKVVGHDCGTKTGVSRPIHEGDVVDRVLLADVKAGPLHLKAGTTLTADIVDKLRATDKNLQVQVRSPLHCEHGKGVCQKCAGLNADGHFHPVGTNIGVISAHAVGERAVQLTMKEFHQGGVVGGSSSTVSGFSRFQQLTMLPGKIPNATSLAHATGKIQKIEETSTGARITINGKAHEIGRDVTGMPLHTLLPNQTNVKGWSPPKVGDHVEAGQPLTDPHRTMINTHDLYRATGSIETVRAHLTDEIHALYKSEGVKRQHVETLVRGMSDSTRVVDPGAAHDVLRGEFRSLSEIQKLNRELQAAGKDPVKHTPVLQGVAVAPLYAQQDWMGKLQHKHLRQTISEAAAVRAKSNIHGVHPVPAIAYGAEFGLNRANSKTPGLQHLADVPEHHFL